MQIERLGRIACAYDTVAKEVLGDRGGMPRNWVRAKPSIPCGNTVCIQGGVSLRRALDVSHGKQNMNDANQKPGKSKRNITWQVVPPPRPCEHTFQLIAHEKDGDLMRCVKCGSLEAEWKPRQS